MLSSSFSISHRCSGNLTCSGNFLLTRPEKDEVGSSRSSIASPLILPSPHPRTAAARPLHHALPPSPPVLRPAPPLPSVRRGGAQQRFLARPASNGGPTSPAARRVELGPDWCLPGCCSWRHGRRKSPAAAAAGSAVLLLPATPCSSGRASCSDRHSPAADLELELHGLLPLSSSLCSTAPLGVPPCRAPSPRFLAAPRLARPRRDGARARLPTAGRH
ncbi:hypothetical protein PVAP13_1NG114271 [Panicum virgatum]|uniref:Uncharacterized protein n=1 Tax=Panicum virgatum TaxID=38727 RepID=A0A8T0WV10_PANVG|nr:hypothetical protein PVAP13_1NG114271 [Panicum virgatum]